MKAPDSVRREAPLTISLSPWRKGETAEEALLRAPRLPLRDVSGIELDPARTWVSLVAGDEALAVSFEALADPPVTAEVRRRHGPVYEDECVELFWAGDAPGGRYLEIVVNPLGTVYAADVLNPDGDRATWKVSPGIEPFGLVVQVEGEAARPPTAWTRWRTSISLPWASLPGDPSGPSGSVFKGNAFRIARGAVSRFEALSPTGRAAPPDFHVPARFARFLKPTLN